MKNNKPFLIVFFITLLLIVGVPQASARMELPGGRDGLRKDDAVTSGIRPAKPGEIDESIEIEVEYEGEEGQPGFAPAVMELPQTAEQAILRGKPTRVEQQLPLQIQERVRERDEQREQREEQLRSLRRSDRAKERMSDVSKSVQELLDSPDREGGISQDIREIAREHQGKLEQLDQDLGDINSRRGFTKLLFGSNRKAVSSVKKEVSQIDGRIARLKALQENVFSEEDQVILINLIEDLEGQRNDILETIEVEETEKGLFGWMGSLFGQNN